LWAPSKNSQRYAYSVELTTLESEDEFSPSFSNNQPNVSAKGGLSDYKSEEHDAEYGGALNDEDDPFQVIIIISYS
jgi:hypothetical protein